MGLLKGKREKTKKESKKPYLLGKKIIRKA
jgi:hypothetical protein